jgi:hypothetical protein
VQPVAVRILHPERDRVGSLEGALLEARAGNGERLVRLFRSAGAADVEWARKVLLPFASRLKTELDGVTGGLVILGDGAIPLATLDDAKAFVEAAGSGEARALTNNRYSSDVLAIGRPTVLRDLPDLAGDNAVPRWLEEVAGLRVDDLRRRWRLSVDLDSPLDALLVDPGWQPMGIDLRVLRDSIAACRAVGGSRRAELVVAGRTSAATVRWLERSTPSRTRALIEERGLRASSPDAMGGPDRPSPRPPRSVVGLLLDDRGPEAFGSILAELGDAAIVDTRVLLAHRLGAGEGAWPDAEDRFASDLLLPERVRDPWLRALTASAVAATIPILLGGHSLVGPGVRLLLRGRR